MYTHKDSWRVCVWSCLHVCVWMWVHVCVIVCVTINLNYNENTIQVLAFVVLTLANRLNKNQKAKLNNHLNQWVSLLCMHKIYFFFNKCECLAILWIYIEVVSHCVYHSLLFEVFFLRNCFSANIHTNLITCMSKITLIGSADSCLLQFRNPKCTEQTCSELELCSLITQR